MLYKSEEYAQEGFAKLSTDAQLVHTISREETEWEDGTPAIVWSLHSFSKAELRMMLDELKSDGSPEALRKFDFVKEFLVDLECS